MTSVKNMTARAAQWLACPFVACLFVLTAAVPALAQYTPVLREQIKVFGELVTLGDLFENAGTAAAAPVFRSPELGTSGVVAAKRVVAAARQHGLDWGNPGRVAEVVVERPSRLVSLDEVRDAIAKHIGGDDEEWSVAFRRGARSFHVDPRVKAPLGIRHVDLQSRTGGFRAVVTFSGSEHPAPDKTFTGRAFPSVEAVVPSRVIERGATITDDDVKTVRVPRSRVTASALNDMADIIGMAATKRLIIDRPIQRADVEHPKLVKRNGMVTLVYQSPGLVVKTKGRALADAARGQVVPIMNLQSKRTIEAEVLGTGLVSVSALNPPSKPAGRQVSSAGGNNAHVVR